MTNICFWYKKQNILTSVPESLWRTCSCCRSATNRKERLLRLYLRLGWSLYKGSALSWTTWFIKNPSTVSVVLHVCAQYTATVSKWKREDPYYKESLPSVCCRSTTAERWLSTSELLVRIFLFRLFSNMLIHKHQYVRIIYIISSQGFSSFSEWEWECLNPVQPVLQLQIHTGLLCVYIIKNTTGPNTKYYR